MSTCEQYSECAKCIQSGEHACNAACRRLQLVDNVQGTFTRLSSNYIFRSPEIGMLKALIRAVALSFFTGPYIYQNAPRPPIKCMPHIRV